MKNLNDFLKANRKKKILLFFAGIVILAGGMAAYEKSIRGGEEWKNLPGWISEPAKFKSDFEKNHPGEIVEISKNELPIGWEVKTCNRALGETMGQRDEFGFDFWGQTPWIRSNWKHNRQGVLVQVPNPTHPHLVYLEKKFWGGRHKKKIERVCMLTFKIENGPEKVGEKIVIEKNVIGHPNVVLLKEKEVTKQKTGQQKIETFFYKFDSSDQLKIVHPSFLGQTD